MKEKVKYLNLIVLLTFLGGQVEYAYTSLFCTMKGAPVSSPSAMMKTDDSMPNSCDECTGVAQPVSSASQNLKSGCMQLRLEQKMVVDNFTGTGKALRHFVENFAVVKHVSTIDDQLFTTTYKLFTPTDSPPLDLPTLNSNLRI